MSREFTLHVTNRDSIPSILCDPLITTRKYFHSAVRCNALTLLGVSPKNKSKKPTLEIFTVMFKDDCHVGIKTELALPVLNFYLFLNPTMVMGNSQHLHHSNSHPPTTLCPHLLKFKPQQHNTHQALEKCERERM